MLIDGRLRSGLRRADERQEVGEERWPLFNVSAQKEEG